MKIKITLGIVVLGILATSAFAESQRAIELNTVRNSIAKANAQWNPKESWVSKLPLEDLQRMLGLRELPRGTLDFESVRTRHGRATSLDWRNKDGVNWLGGMMNQGNCGSCVAFATV